jgi:hypothetical protein
MAATKSLADVIHLRMLTRIPREAFASRLRNVPADGA